MSTKKKRRKRPAMPKANLAMIHIAGVAGDGIVSGVHDAMESAAMSDRLIVSADGAVLSLGFLFRHRRLLNEVVRLGVGETCPFCNHGTDADSDVSLSMIIDFNPYASIDFLKRGDAVAAVSAAGDFKTMRRLSMAVWHVVSLCGGCIGIWDCAHVCGQPHTHDMNSFVGAVGAGRAVSVLRFDGHDFGFGCTAVRERDGERLVAGLSHESLVRTLREGGESIQRATGDLSKIFRLSLERCVRAQAATTCER